VNDGDGSGKGEQFALTWAGQSEAEETYVVGWQLKLE
jgi:hypothetical protein